MERYYALLLPSKETIEQINGTILPVIGERVNFPHITFGSAFDAGQKDDVINRLLNTLPEMGPITFTLGELGDFSDRVLYWTSPFKGEIRNLKNCFRIFKMALGGTQEKWDDFKPHLTLFSGESKKVQIYKEQLSSSTRTIALELEEIKLSRQNNSPRWENLGYFELGQSN